MRIRYTDAICKKIKILYSKCKVKNYSTKIYMNKIYLIHNVIIEIY